MRYSLRNRSNDPAPEASPQQTSHSQHAVVQSEEHSLIHRFPAEIMKMILLPIIDQRNRWMSSITLGSVCRRWRVILNDTKSLWNDIYIRYPNTSQGKPGGTYPCPEFLQIILKRASGSPIKLWAHISIHEYSWLFEVAKDALPDISRLTLMPTYEAEGTPHLDQTIFQLDLPSLEHLTMNYRANGDSPALRAFFECFLDVAARSRIADSLSLHITCPTDALSSLFAGHQAFIKSSDILLCAASRRLFSAPPAQSISLPNVQHLDVRCLEHVTKYLVAPKLRSLSTSYGGGDDSNHLVMLEPIASQLEKLTLNMGHWQPVSNGCPVPFVNLKELHIVNVLPRGSGTSLVLTPNLELLDVGHWIGSSVKLAIHCLGYILGPKGMLGPIRGLKTLRLGNLILSDKKKADYCTSHLRFHPLLENLTIHRNELPKDFLDLLPNPVSSPDGFLPNLKKIQFHQCSPTNPSNEWFAELARGRPLLTVISY